MNREKKVKLVANKYLAMARHLDERARRIWAAVEANSLGWGGISIVSDATKISDRTIRNGIKDLKSSVELENSKQRSKGGGRKKLESEHPEILKLLDNMIDPGARGDPMNPLRWTTKSTKNLASVIAEMGINVSPRTVARLLKEQGFSLQSNRKTREGTDHPDRNEQFEFISKRIKARFKFREPALSVDTKKKENIGLKKNNGRVYRPIKSPIEVDMHDFPNLELGKAIPYGVYDIASNQAGVSIGITKDTAEFAVAAINRWWLRLGKKRFGKAKRILITAHSGGSNSSRSKLWKLELQKFADETGKIIEVCHYPPGTSKWNKIEHRLFCHITRNWSGVPLESLEIVLELIAATVTESGLEVHAWLDPKEYFTGKKVSKDQLADCIIKPNKFHGEWNYEVHPRKIR